MDVIFITIKHRNKYKEAIQNWFKFVFVSAVYSYILPSFITLQKFIKKILSQNIFNVDFVSHILKQVLTKNRTARCFGIILGRYYLGCALNK